MNKYKYEQIHNHPIILLEDTHEFTPSGLIAFGDKDSRLLVDN